MVDTPAINERLRVAIVAPSLRQFLGGQEVQGDQLAREWEGDADVRAQLVATNPPLPGALRWLERVPVLRTLVRLPLRLATLWRVVGDSDVVHVFAGAGSSFLVGTVPALFVAAVRRTPTLVHYHSPRGDAHLARSAFARRVLRRCGAVVVPSEYLRESFARHEVSSIAIANVVDLSRFPLRTAEPRDARVLSMRNFEPRYGVDDAIRAFAIVKRARPESALVLAGSGPEEGNLRALVRSLGLSDVTFTGATSRDVMGALMTSAAVMLNASRIDNMPVSILEAFSAGVPVVTTAAGGITHMTRHGETALVADVGDVTALAQHVLTVLGDRSLARRLALAAHEAGARCTWPAVRPAWLALYRRLAAARSSSPR